MFGLLRELGGQLAESLTGRTMPILPECYSNKKKVLEGLIGDDLKNVNRCPYLKKRLEFRYEDPGTVNIYRVFCCTHPEADRLSRNYSGIKEALTATQYRAFCMLARQMHFREVTSPSF